MMRTRLPVALLVALLGAPAAGIATPASASHVPSVPDYNVVDGTPICGTEGGTQATGSLAAGEGLSFGTYNLLHSQAENDDADVSDRFLQYAGAIAGAGADVWGFQEVTNNEEHGNVAQRVAAHLATQTGEPWEWCWSLSNPRFPAEPDVFPGGGGPLSLLPQQFGNLPQGDLRNLKEGLAIVTRFHVTDTKFRRLQPRGHEAASCPVSFNPLDLFNCQFAAVFDSRQILWAQLDAGATDVDMFTTHIAHGLTDHSDATKQAQVEKALDTIAEWSDPATIDLFTGDFNSNEDTSRYATIINDGFEDTFEDSTATDCGDSSADVTDGCTSDVHVLTDTNTQSSAWLTERIDHVFAKGTAACDVTAAGAQVIGRTPEQIPDGRWRWPSDHFGVSSTIDCA